MKLHLKIFLTLSIFLSVKSFCQEDSTAPVFNSISIDSQNVNTGDEITFTINTTDDISGISFIHIRYENPNGQQKESKFSSIRNSPNNWNDIGNNNYSFTTTLNEFAINGQWYVNFISISDNANNNYAKSYNSSNSPLTFNVINNTEDSTPPVFNSISIDSQNVNAGDEIMFTINATDDNSDISFIHIRYENPNGQQRESKFSSIRNSPNNWNDIGNNDYSFTTTLNEFAMNGQWYVNFISITDNADNNYAKSYNSSNSPLTFNVINNTEDSTPPVFNSISIDSQNVNAGDEITFTINTTDDISGISFIHIRYENPNGQQKESKFSSIRNSPNNWNDIGNNNYSFTTTLNEFAINGQWYVNFISISDNANNNYAKSYNSSNSPLTFNVTNKKLSSNEITSNENIQINKIDSNTYHIQTSINIKNTTLYNLSGQQISLDTPENIKIINLNNVAKGVYILNISTSKGSVIKKIYKD